MSVRRKRADKKNAKPKPQKCWDSYITKIYIIYIMRQIGMTLSGGSPQLLLTPPNSSDFRLHTLVIDAVFWKLAGQSDCCLRKVGTSVLTPEALCRVSARDPSLSLSELRACGRGSRPPARLALS